MDVEVVDKAVQAYLEMRGFKQASLALQQEKQQRSKGVSNGSSTPHIDPDVAELLLQFAELDISEEEEHHGEFESSDADTVSDSDISPRKYRQFSVEEHNFTLGFIGEPEIQMWDRCWALDYGSSDFCRGCDKIRKAYNKPEPEPWGDAFEFGESNVPEFGESGVTESRASSLTMECPVPAKPNKSGQQLVLCYVQLPLSSEDSPWPDCYRFHSFPTDKLICCPSSSSTTQVQQLEAEEKFEWSAAPNVFDMLHQYHIFTNFLKVQEGRDSILYAVTGGLEPRCSPIDWHDRKPYTFYRFSLSTPLLNTRVATMEQMIRRKHYPLIAEVGGFIYVLCWPCPDSPCYLASVFEVYDPSKDEWTRLRDPPFFTEGYNKAHCSVKHQLFPYLVIRGKLIVSCGSYSSIYDPASDKWEVCGLFSGLSPRFVKHYGYEENDYNSLPCCGPPFPFVHRPVLLHQETILLCVDDTVFIDSAIPLKEQLLERACYKSEPLLYKEHLKKWTFIPPISAYKITDEKTRVDEIPLKLDPLPYGEFSDLVDLGDDHVAVLLHKKGRAESDGGFATVNCVTIATFKLEFKRAEENESLIIVGELKSLWDCEDVPLRCNVRYAFTM